MLTNRQRQIIVYGLSFVYLVCSIWMVAQFFLPHREEKPPIPMGELVDSPIQRDTTYIKRMEHLVISNYGA